MCIRYVAGGNLQGLQATVRGPSPDQEELFPGEAAEILRISEDGSRELVTAKWGLTPHWAKDANWGKRSAYNARSESIREKPTFREAFKKRRCIVPAVALYEQQEGRWIRFAPKDMEFFAVAGLWEPANDLSGADTYTMVTTDSNSIVLPANDRMPVILHPDEMDLWISHDAPVDGLMSLLVACPSEWMVAEDDGPTGRKKKGEDTLF
ncbi:SOS response-associated peptidase [bacterium]|nr:MAG: SOS response-associated peptidase [bacterium]